MAKNFSNCRSFQGDGDDFQDSTAMRAMLEILTKPQRVMRSPTKLATKLDTKMAI